MRHGSKYSCEIKVKPSFRNRTAFGLTDQSQKLNFHTKQLMTRRFCFLPDYLQKTNRHCIKQKRFSVSLACLQTFKLARALGTASFDKLNDKRPQTGIIKVKPSVLLERYLTVDKTRNLFLFQKSLKFGGLYGLPR